MSSSVRQRSTGALIQGWYCPLPRADILAKRIAKGDYVFTPTGMERRCPRCNEFWPADTEFFFAALGKPEGLFHWCRACYVEYRWPERYGLTQAA